MPNSLHLVPRILKGSFYDYANETSLGLPGSRLCEFRPEQRLGCLAEGTWVRGFPARTIWQMAVVRMMVWFRRPASASAEGVHLKGDARRFEQLLSLAKQLDADALGELYQQFLPVVYGTVAARVSDRRAAEDITSEVFVSMLESIGNLRATDEAGFAAWLLRITRFRIADHFRSQAGEPQLAAATMTSDEGEETETLLTLPTRDPSANPELTAEAREEWAVVAAAINQLTEDQRQVIVGKLVLGYDNETVARLVGKNVTAVKALQHRGLQMLQRLLGGGGKTGPQPGLSTRPPRRKEGKR